MESHEVKPSPGTAKDKKELLRLLGRIDLTLDMVTPDILEAGIDDIVRKGRGASRNPTLVDKDMVMPRRDVELESAKTELLAGNFDGSGLIDRILALPANKYPVEEVSRRLGEMCDAIIQKKISTKK